jgi:acetyl esterase
MPLDPQVGALLEQMAALGARPFNEMTPEEARAQMLANRGQLPELPVANVEDRAVPGPGGEIPIRIYTPAAGGPLSVVVYFHGGGWVIGNIESHDATCRALANESGCIVVSVDYRLAPEHKFPAAAEDCYAATVWAAKHAAEFGGDASRLAVAGDSAGGNLAAVVALMARDRGGPRIAFQLLVYPVTDYSFDRPSYSENAEGYLLSRDAMRWFWNHYLSDESEGLHPHASPLRAESLAGLPAALVLTAEFDPLRDEGEEYAALLRAAGVAAESVRYDGLIHGFFSFFQVIDRGGEAMRHAGGTLRSTLAGEAARPA